jgi:hypothetical protein
MSARYPFGTHRGSFPSKIEVVTAATRHVYGALSGPLITPLALAPSRRVSPCPHGCSRAIKPYRPTPFGRDDAGFNFFVFNFDAVWCR